MRQTKCYSTGRNVMQRKRNSSYTSYNRSRQSNNRVNENHYHSNDYDNDEYYDKPTLTERVLNKLTSTKSSKARKVIRCNSIVYDDAIQEENYVKL